MITTVTLCTAALTLLTYVTYFALFVSSVVAVIMERSDYTPCDFQETWTFLFTHMGVGACMFVYFARIVKPDDSPRYAHVLIVLVIQLAFSVWGVLVVTNDTLCTFSRTYITACVYVAVDFLSVLTLSCGLNLSRL